MALDSLTRISAFALCVFCCSYLTSSQAPGDEDEECKNITSYADKHLRPLMDTAHYLQLLPNSTGGGGVWKALDFDSSTGGRSSWHIESSSGCTTITTVCDDIDIPEHSNNWMITQHITRQVMLTNTVVAFPDIHVMLDLTFLSPINCTQPSCVDNLSLHLWETSVADNTSAANTDNYRLIAHINSGVKNVTIPFSSVRHSGFYLGIRDTGTCVHVNRVLIYYTACEATTVGLIRVSETVYSSSSVSVQGDCIENSVPVNNTRPLLKCTERGEWRATSRCPHDISQCQACVCRAGYGRETRENGKQFCTACPVGMFSARPGDQCSNCPDNSNTTQPGMVECLCDKNYYRPSYMGSRDACIMLSAAQDESVSSELSDTEMIGLVLGLFCGVLTVAISFVLGVLLGKYLQKHKYSSQNVPVAPFPRSKPPIGARQTVDTPVYEEVHGLQSGDGRCLEYHNASLSTGVDGNTTVQSQEHVYQVLEDPSTMNVIPETQRDDTHELL